MSVLSVQCREYACAAIKIQEAMCNDIEEIGTVLEDSLRSQRSFALHTTTNTLENELYPRTRVEHHPAGQTLTIIDSPNSYDEQ